MLNLGLTWLFDRVEIREMITYLTILTYLTSVTDRWVIGFSSEHRKTYDVVVYD